VKHYKQTDTNQGPSKGRAGVHAAAATSTGGDNSNNGNSGRYNSNGGGRCKCGSRCKSSGSDGVSRTESGGGGRSERVQGGMNEHQGRHKRAQAGTRGARRGDEHARVGMNEHEASGGVTNEHRGTNERRGTNAAGAAVGATCPSSLVPLPSRPPPTIF
jgi:hypothetical protein